jgi:hypothetical protein
VIDLTVPPKDVLWDSWLGQLRHASRTAHNLPLARRAALLRLLWLHSYLRREVLIRWIEEILQRPCFEPATFAGDLAIARRALAEAGYQLRYSRWRDRSGYYIEGRPVLDEGLVRLIAGAVAEVDPAQIAISRRLTPAQHFQQGRSMVRLARQVTLYRQRQRNPQLQETHELVREGGYSEMPEGEMDFAEFMRLVLDALEAAEVEYMIGGAIAVWAWGEARTTRDFDLVVNIPFENIPKLSEELEKRDMLVPVEVILDLLTKMQGDLPLNAIHLYTGYKAELFLLRYNDPQRATALSRRRLVDLGPPLGPVYVHAPEDLILYKLHYFTLSHQPKHVRDIASMLETLGDTLDLAYLESWATRLNLMAVWREIKDQAAGDNLP